MLYISRCIGQEKYGVVDTDDGIETIVDMNIIKGAIRSGVDIVGAKVARFRSPKAIPYQPPETMTKLQVKYKLVSNIDITCYGETISNIQFHNSADAPVDVRLSDFGSVLGDRVLTGNSTVEGHRVTLIFDDKIKVSEFSIPRGNHNTEQLGLKLDVREVTDLKQLSLIYFMWCSDVVAQRRFEALIDQEDRRWHIWLLYYHMARAHSGKCPRVLDIGDLQCFT